MKALIIGGTGTISKAVVDLLIKKDWEVYVLNCKSLLAVFKR